MAPMVTNNGYNSLNLQKKHDCLLIYKAESPTNACFQLRVFTSGHMTKIAVTPFDSPYLKNPMLHANITGLCLIERELLPIEVLHCRNRNFRPFGSCDLDLDPTTFIYELEPQIVEIYRICKYELPILRQGFRKLSSDSHTYRHTHRQTDIHTRPKLYTTHLRGWSTTLSVICTAQIISISVIIVRKRKIHTNIVKVICACSLPTSRQLKRYHYCLEHLN